MARVMQLGWEQGDPSVMDLADGGGEVVKNFTRGSWSKWARRCSGASSAGTKSLGASASEFYVGFGVNCSETGDGLEVTFSSPNGTAQLCLDVTSGYINVRRGASGGTSLGTSSPVVAPASTWMYIEFHFTIHDTTGVVDVKLDGQTVIALTGQDTKNDGASALVDRVLFAHGSLSATTFYDDFVCNDINGPPNNSWPGDTKIVGLWPNAAGDTTMLNRPSTSDLATEILADTPWMYLKLDETSGTNADDSSPNNRDGTYVGTPTLGADSGLEGIRAGDNEVNFDGSDDEITLPAQTFALASATSPLTVLLWFKTASESMTLIGADDVADADPHFRVRVANTGGGGSEGRIEVSWRATDGTGNQTSNVLNADFPYQVTDNKWHMLAVTFDSAKLVSWYIDGRLVDSLTHTMASGLTCDRCILGRDPEATSGYNRFVGKMTEFAVFQSTLTLARIKLLYALTWRNFEELDDSSMRRGPYFGDFTGFAGANTVQQPGREDDIAFVQETTIDDLDLYNMDDVPGDFDTVQAVQVWSRARKSDAGTGLFAFLLKSGGSTNTGADVGLAAGSWRQFTKVYDRNPIGPADWTTSSVNAAQAGLKVR